MNQPGMQQQQHPQSYQQQQQHMGNSTMPPAPGMAPNHLPNTAPHPNTHLSGSFGRLSLQVNCCKVVLR